MVAYEQLDEIAKRVMEWHFDRQRRLLKQAAGAYACAPMARLPAARRVVAPAAPTPQPVGCLTQIHGP